MRVIWEGLEGEKRLDTLYNYIKITKLKKNTPTLSFSNTLCIFISSSGMTMAIVFFFFFFYVSLCVCMSICGILLANNSKNVTHCWYWGFSLVAYGNYLGYFLFIIGCVG